MFKKVLESSRHITLLGVVCSLIASAFAFGWGTWKTGVILWNILNTSTPTPLIAVKLIELMDKFLIASGLYIFSVGLYELFIGPLDLPKWLSVHDLHEIKTRLSSILVLVMIITFLEHVVLWQDPKEVLMFAIAIATIIVALLVFNKFSAIDS